MKHSTKRPLQDLIMPAQLIVKQENIFALAIIQESYWCTTSTEVNNVKYQ